MRWLDALKEWNKGSPKWCIPKKGSAEHDAVKAIMAGKKIEAPDSEKKVESKAMSIPLKSIMKKKKPVIGDAPPAPPMKIPIEPQRKAFSDSMAPKIKFVEPAKKAEPAPAPKEEKFGDEKDDHYITDDLIYKIQHRINWDEAGELKDFKKLKEAISYYREKYGKDIKTPHQHRIVMKLDKVLDRMKKEHGRKQRLDAGIIQNYLQPLFTYDLMIASNPMMKRAEIKKKIDTEEEAKYKKSNLKKMMDQGLTLSGRPFAI